MINYTTAAPTLFETTADLIVFYLLEFLDLIGFCGNILLLIVIFRSGLLERPSFVLISSLAISDVLHCIVTSVYFYPPIGMRSLTYSRTSARFMNAVDWTAWGITLTHMSAICIDRLMAILLLHMYGRITTVRRMLFFTVTCWTVFITVNATLASYNVCCLIVPQPEYYTFGFEALSVNDTSINVFKPIYVPLEIGTIFTLAICNPITLFRLYRRYKRTNTMKRASFVFLEATTRTFARHRVSLEPTQATLSKDAKIFIQIIGVTVIFFLYMFIYYLFFYVMEMTQKWSAVLNSFLYTTCHMINPIVYFSLNEQMQDQLVTILRLCALYIPKKIGSTEADPLLMRTSKAQTFPLINSMKEYDVCNSSIMFDTPSTPASNNDTKFEKQFPMKTSSSDV